MRRMNDAYYTPDTLAARLVALLPIEATDTVMEPSAGGGAFVRALLPRCARVLACDVEDCEGLRSAHTAHRGDFLQCGIGGHWTVGNPPYREWNRHLDHALTLGRHVAFLLRLAVMESAARAPMWQRWPLRRVWVLAERPSFTGGTSDNAAYGFFWFDRHHAGAAEIVPGWRWR